MADTATNGDASAKALASRAPEPGGVHLEVLGQYQPPNSPAKNVAGKSRLANPDLVGTPEQSSIIAATPMVHTPTLDKITVANLPAKKTADEPFFSPAAIWSSITAPTADERSGRIPGPVHSSVNLTAGDLFSPLNTVKGTIEMAHQVRTELSEHHRVGTATTFAAGTLLASIALPALKGLRGLRGAETEAMLGESEALATEASAERNSAQKLNEKTKSEPGLGRAAVIGGETIELATAQRALENMRPPTVKNPIDDAIDRIAEQTQITNPSRLLSVPRLDFGGLKPISGSAYASDLPQASALLQRTLMPKVDIRITEGSMADTGIGQTSAAQNPVLQVQYARYYDDGTRAYLTESGKPAILIDPNTNSNTVFLPGGKQTVRGVPDFILSGDHQVDLFFRSAAVDQDLRSSSVHISTEDTFGSGTVLTNDQGITVMSTSYHGPVQRAVTRDGLENATVDVTAIDHNFNYSVFQAGILHADPLNDVAYLYSTNGPSHLSPLAPEATPAALSPGAPVRFRGYGFNFLDPLGATGRMIGRYPIVPAPEFGSGWSKIDDVPIQPGVPFNPAKNYGLFKLPIVTGGSGAHVGDGIALIGGQGHTVVLRGTDIPAPP